MLSQNLHDAFEIAKIPISLFIFTILIFILCQYFFYSKLQQLSHKWFHFFRVLFFKSMILKSFVSYHLLSIYYISDIVVKADT